MEEKRVYVVARGSCSTCLQVVGVYSTFEKAEGAALEFFDTGIETWVLDSDKAEPERVDFPDNPKNTF